MTAAEVLIKSGISSLPVDLRKIADTYNIKIVSYEDCTSCYETDLPQLYREMSPYGFSFCDEGRYIAAINENSCGKQRRHWTLAHELSHILLGHIDGSSEMQQRCEQEADRFAAELLAPLTVLQFCGVSSAEEIQRICGISFQAAEIRFRQLSQQRRQGSRLLREGGSGTVFTQSNDDKQLLERFLPFISEYITRRSSHDGYAEYLRRIKGHDMVIE